MYKTMNNGWETLQLEKLCNIDIGKTPYRANNTFWDKKKATTNVWLSIADLLNANDKSVSDSKEYISDKGASISKVVKAGTLLLSFKLTLGRLAFAGRDLFTNEAIAALTIRNEKQISKKFLYYFLSFFDWHTATEGDLKIKGKTLNKAKLKAIAVHFPNSLAEQQSIVAILDKSFAAIAKATENTEKNLQNAQDLFKSYLQNIFSNPGDGWEIKKLGEITFKIGSGSTPKGGSKAHKSTGTSLIRSLNVHDMVFKHNNLARLDEAKAQKLSNVMVEGGDILVNIIGASVARCCMVPSEILPACVNQNVSIIRVDKKVIASEFLSYLLTSKLYKDELLRIGRKGGSTMQVITKAELARLCVSFPSLQEQRRIVAKLDALSSETKKLEAVYQRKLSDLDELKKSMLNEAFNGRLTKSPIETQSEIFTESQA